MAILNSLAGRSIDQLLLSGSGRSIDEAEVNACISIHHDSLLENGSQGDITLQAIDND